MNESYEESSVEGKLDNEAVFYIKSYFYGQIMNICGNRSLIKKSNLSEKDDEFFINKDEDKSDIKKIKKKINNLYQSALKIDTKTDNWKIEEQKIKNNLVKVLNKEGGCCALI